MVDLIITNGDSAGELLRRTLQGTEVLPWRDVLHEGPVPLTETREELGAARVAFLAEAGAADPGVLENDFEARYRGLSISANFDRVILWFEHDLYDQLQLLQVLDWFADHPREPETLLMVQTDEYIARQEPEAIVDEAALARPVTDAQLDLAVRAWAAFRQPTPEAWAHLLREDISALPFLRGAVVRMLEELPGPDGVTRTERLVLACLNAGSGLTAVALFGAVQKMEDAEFMGDWSFWRVLDGLALGPAPLIAGLDGASFQVEDKARMEAYVKSQPALTTLGKDVVEGRADWAERHPIDRWWGGTHLTNARLWRWDPETEHLIAPL
ncbi:hypothetical protein AUC70_06785 [Methyloceanibacter stevinii]|uniref:DUF1835 domain-containing protein n=1 Tax=Methyloceanibacter stevinii TaxID=1774970 RepID=A0A1E3VN43_9HYPH|nr:DUF1835 domain-containing protein [Methyloceanibacter stevinii]ODR94376.1 hypothetical protein AUC70_06785 [Methyloceanibacter stevinii]